MDKPILEISAQYEHTLFWDGADFWLCYFSTNTPIDTQYCITNSYWQKRNKYGFIAVFKTGIRYAPAKSFQYLLKGNWAVGKRGDYQFEVVSESSSTDNTEENIIDYLQRIDGIGPALAKNIYKKFGQDSLDVVKDTPDLLRTVPKMPKKKFDDVLNSIKSNIDYDSVCEFFKDFSIPMSSLNKAFKARGLEMLKIARKSPFDLASNGFSFQMCDEIHFKMNMAADASDRCINGLQHVLVRLLARSGNLYVPKKTLITATLSFLNKLTEEQEIELNATRGPNQTSKISLKRITSDTLNNAFLKGTSYFHLVGRPNGECLVYSCASYFCEKQAAKKIVDINHNPNIPRIDDTTLNVDIAAAESQFGFLLSASQKQAIKGAINSGFSVITGGPGTGKTTILKFILEIFKKRFSKKIVLCAPTGRAARRMAESTGWDEAQTIHSLLGITSEFDFYNFETMNENELLHTDLIVVDEVSMIDMEIAYALLASVSYDTKVIFLGDPEQLPSVGPGNVLREIINSQVVPCFSLDIIYRQAQESKIVSNSNNLRLEKNLFTFDDKFQFVEASDSAAESQIVKSYFEQINLPGKNVYNVQILTPFKLNKYCCSSYSLNSKIQKRLLESGKLDKNVFASNEAYRFYVNDKVIQQLNTDEAKNGDIGTVTRIYMDGPIKMMEIDFEDKRVTYKTSEISLCKIALAYAITIHKSQGSEYDTVIMPMLDSHRNMLSRNLVYTAWTRAKETVIMYGQKSALTRSIHVSNIENRLTLLARRIYEREQRYRKSA